MIAPEAEAREILASSSQDSSEPVLTSTDTTFLDESTPDLTTSDVGPERDTHIKQEDDSIAENTTPTTLRPNVVPSLKRRESKAAANPADSIERPAKKRKRNVSPPWQFPTAETTTIKTSDGRRVSARVNTSSTPNASESEGGRGRSISLSTGISRPASPPWKKFEAEGPTSIQVDGIRKSGRVNKELNTTPKRVSPRTKKLMEQAAAQQSRQNGGAVGKGALFDTRKPDPASHKAAKGTSQLKGSSRESTRKIAELQAQIAALQPNRTHTLPTRLGKNRRQSTAVDSDGDLSDPSSPISVKKSHRLSNVSLSPEQSRPSPRLKLRTNSVRRIIPPPHPQAQSRSPPHPPQLSLHQVIEDYELREAQQPYTENDRGPPGADFFLQRAQRVAQEEGIMRRRLLREAAPGGVLSRERLSIFRDERQREPPQQYGHMDHVVAHALYLRLLQQREKTQHKALAKKLALEAVEHWRSMHGPTEEDLIAEQTKILELIKKQVVADMKAKWEMVEAYVINAKKARFEAEQEARRAEKLRKKLEWSENMLARQRGLADSDDETNDVTDEEEDIDESIDGTLDSDAEEEDESEDQNMSSSESEAEEGDDAAEMNDDELQKYLAQRAAEPPDPQSSEDEENESGDEGEAVTKDKQAKSQEDGGHSDNDLPHAQTSDLLTDALMQDDMDEADGEDDEAAFEPTEDNEAVGDEDESETVERRKSRATAQLLDDPINEDEDDSENNLSSDESVDMDSEDYDSDEDESSEEEDEESDEEPGMGKNLLAGFFDRKTRESLFSGAKVDGGLPTPNTSVENGGDNERPRSRSKDSSAGQSTDRDDVDATMADAAAAPMEPVQADTEEQHDDKMAIDKVARDEALSHAATPPSADDLVRKEMVPQPTLLRGTLRSYQHAGLDWLASLYRNGTNGILADEMGLGKTIQTIALLAHLAEVHEVWETHLVIVPNSVVLNWVSEFQKFLPGFRVLAYYGSAEERMAKRRHWTADPHADKEHRGYNVVVMSYEIAVKDINSLRVHQWHYLILDEAHNIRNFQSMKWQLLIRLRTRARLLLTGTPLQNNLTELWALLTFLTAGDDDGSHGELEEFMSHWKDPVKEIFDQGVQKISEDSQKIVHQLHISLRPFLLRRKKDEVEKDLPKKIESVVVCKLSKRQRQLYQDYMGLTEIKAALARGSGIQASSVLLSLRKVCNHPDLFDPRPIQTSFAMERSPVEVFGIKESLIRRLLGYREGIFDKFIPTGKEHLRRAAVQRSRRLTASSLLQKQVNDMEKSMAKLEADAATFSGSIALQQIYRQKRKLERTQACITMTDLALRDAPIYGVDLRELVSFRKPNPYVWQVRNQVNTRRLRFYPAIGLRPMELPHAGDAILVKASQLQQDIATCQSYASRLQDVIVRFTFVPPAVTVPMLNSIIPKRVQEQLRAMPQYPQDIDFAHEARIRASIAFPDKRLLIYDSGKLQRLTYLLRELQAKGSRTLIFTQMVGTLDVLERFLNLLNLPYLRLDGSTPLERRQLYTAEFNRPDSKYQCMILSSRAGGVGLNLTGASSVIFYDLDWNPQMDRQCMDRAHRIGQSRDVEVFKMVSEKTVEENILRRANQKSLLDQTVIQEGQFTTEYQQPAARHDSSDPTDNVENAIERLFGGGEKSAVAAFESVEDKEDVVAAQQARKEDQTRDEIVDFVDQRSKASTPAPNAVGGGGEVEAEERKGHVDLYMIAYMEELLRHVVYVPPPVRRLDKNGRDPSHRPKRKR